MQKRTDPLDSCQKSLSYRFRDISLLKEALTHSSSADLRKDSNERMEFLGDAVLELVICQELYEQLPDAMEGELTKIKSAVVSRRVCARVANKLHLPDALILGQGMEPGSNLPQSLAAAVLESVIAAIYLDGGLDAARKVILDSMGEEIARANKSDHQYNFKSQLQQHAQRKMGATPIYELLDEKGPDHAKCFEVAVTVGSRQFPGAWGPSKKEAEQKAAWMALSELGIVHEAFSDTDGDSERQAG